MLRYNKMSINRLALERSASAEEAIETIAALVGVHNVADGQTIKQAFVICGENQIWLMNVVGKWWAAELLTGNLKYKKFLHLNSHIEYRFLPNIQTRSVRLDRDCRSAKPSLRVRKT